MRHASLFSVKTGSPNQQSECVREARPEDVSAIIVLERAAASAAHWREEEYRRIFEPGSVPRLGLVSEQLDGIAGFLVATAVGDEWEIENVVVAGARKRRGTGSGLLRELAALAQKAGTTAIVLEVRESNAAARGLYEKCGFEMVGRRRAYYRGPDEDALIYRLRISSV